MNARALLWARSGLIWVLVAMVAGLHLGMTGEFGAASHHAHAGLLGGVWAIVFAWLFDRTRAPLDVAGKTQWALYNLGVAIMAVAMFLVVRQSGQWGPVIGMGGLVVFGTTVWIVASAWPRGERPA